MATGVGIDPARIAQLTEREEAHLNSETSGSARMYERSRKVMPMGVASSYQARSPHPIFLERGSGSKVWDVDGSEYRDFHNGFGSMVQGHGHPAITRAVAERMPLGTHFAAMTEDSVVVAEELARRWGLPKWRFTNSGSESTMDAIRLARAHTGREVVIKMEGSYHGHHDTVMVSIGIDIDDAAVGPANRPNSVPYGGGIPASTVANTIPVPFNDADALDARLTELAGTGRLRDHGARHDEHRRRAAAGRLPGRRARDHAKARRRADLRRGQDRHHDRRRRRSRALGRHARPRHAREGARRRAAERRDRRLGGGHGLDRERPRLPGGHLQRQPAEHGGRTRELRGGHDAGGLRRISSISTIACTTASPRSSTSTASRRT